MLALRLERAHCSPWQPYGELVAQAKYLVVPATRIDKLDIEGRPLRELRSHKPSHRARHRYPPPAAGAVRDSGKPPSRQKARMPWGVPRPVGAL